MWKRVWRILRPEDIRIDLTRAIQSLPEHYREVILLRDIEEMSIDEIAGVLGLTRESVKARIHRARMMIREYLIRMMLTFSRSGYCLASETRQ